MESWKNQSEKYVKFASEKGYKRCWLVGWLTVWLTAQLTRLLRDWLTNCVAGGLSDLTLADWLVGWLTDQMTGWVTQRLNNLLVRFYHKATSCKTLVKFLNTDKQIVVTACATADSDSSINQDTICKVYWLFLLLRRLSTIIGPLQKLRVIKFSLVDPLCRGEGGGTVKCLDWRR